MAKTISSLSVILGATVAPFVSGINSARSATSGFLSSLAGAGGTLAKFTGIGAAVGGVLGAIGGIGQGLSIAAELEQNAVAFETMLGSASAAQGLLSDLTKFAASTPFEFPELAASAKKLLAFGIATDKIMPSLKSIGDVASGVGTNVSELAEIYGKAKTAGTLYAEDINQLVGRGIPVIQEFAKQMGVTEGEVKKLASQGKITFPMLEKAFQDLTGEGGKFAGMMDKQSRTLAGLWSTLTDNIGMALAGVTQTIIDAFDVKAAMTNVINTIGTAGAWINTQVKTWAPVVVGVMKAIYTGATGWLAALWGYIAPVFTAISAFITSNWQSIVQTEAGLLSASWGFIKTVFSGIWTIVKTVASAVAAAWTWAMDLLGIKSVEGADTTGSVVNTIGTWWKWGMQQLTLAINVITFGLQNLGTIAAWLATTVAYNVVKIGNEFTYVFTDVIPGVLKWFANNWRDVFTTIWNFYKSVWSNIAANTANFAAALWSFLKGEGFNFQWTGLLTGFENTVKELPKIAERQVGALEKSLGDQAATLGNALGNGLSDYLQQQDRAAKDGAKAFNDAVGGLMPKPPEIPAPATPEVPAITVPTETATIDTGDAEKSLDGLNDKAKDVAGTLATVLAGSAEAMQIRAQAAFDANKIDPAQTVTARAEPVAATPIAGATARGVRGSAAPKDESQWKQQLLTVLQKLAGKSPIEFGTFDTA